MPKIIENLKEKILEVAKGLFISMSFDEVDMKMISKETGIATGTLYNYFPNKALIYFAVIEIIRQAQLEELRRIADMEIDPKDRLNLFISTFYENQETIGSIDDSLLRREGEKFKEKSPELFTKIKRSERDYYYNMSIIFWDMFGYSNDKIKYNEDFCKRLMLCQVKTINSLIRIFKNEKEKNLEFIKNMIDFFIDNEQRKEEHKND